MSETDLTDYDILERARAMTKAMQDEADRMFEININSAQSLENLHTEKAVHTDGSTDDFPSENRLGEPRAKDVGKNNCLKPFVSLHNNTLIPYCQANNTGFNRNFDSKQILWSYFVVRSIVERKDLVVA